MDLTAQFIAMGMTPEQAQENANNFVSGLKELGLSDIETPTPELVSLIKKKNPIDKILLRAGVNPGLVDKYGAALANAMLQFGIDTPRRTAMFLAQILHESMMLRATVENLNYSEQTLVRVFGKYFDRNTAKYFARNPQKIANKVYANRMGNGPESSGEGWKFRGRGFIQLTGKSNYIACGTDLQKDLITNPDFLSTPEGAAESAAWYWNKHGLNASADRGDIVTNTRIINGGKTGLSERTTLYQRILPLC